MAYAGLFVATLALLRVSHVAAVGECATTPCDLAHSVCVDDGYYGYATCQCEENYDGQYCDTSGNYLACDHGNVFEINAEITSNGFPDKLLNRLDCGFLVNMHGVDVINVTVLYFDFEELKDGLDYAISYTVDLNESPVTYDNGTRLTSFQNPAGYFWMNIFTDRNVRSGGYRIILSGDGNDCLSVEVPCQNGGTCVDAWQNYTCECPSGFEGYYCEVDVDNCRSDPCLNGATCNNDVLGYNCTCLPSFTGQNCEIGIVIVASSSPVVDSTLFEVYEGSSTQSLDFDLTFSPSSLATYSVGGAGTSGLWSIDVFFSPNPSGSPSIIGEQTLTTLTAAQQITLWDPPSSTTISNIQATNVNVGTSVTCAQLQYFCARIGRGNNPTPEFEIRGDPSSLSLLGCTSVTCRGVEISDTSLTVTSDDLREGVASQTVTFDFTLDSVSDAGSVAGSNLWQFSAFGSQNADGGGTRTSSYDVTLSPAQSSVGVTAGDQSQFTGLSFDVDLSGETNCADVPYICVTVDKGSSPRPDFTLTGIPNANVFTSCQQVTCRDVEIIDSAVSVPGVIREGESNSVGLSVSLTAAANGGTAVGSGLWNITGFASNNNDGSGARYGESSLALSATQAATTLNFGSSATIGGITFPLDLQNGPTCSQLGYICVVVEKGNNASPDYELTPAQSTSCSQVDCRSVEISDTSLTVTSGDLREGVASQTVTFDFTLDSVSDAGSVAGSNLWQFSAFGSQNADGGGTRTSSYDVTLSPAQSSVGVTAGDQSQFTGLSFDVDLSGETNCADVPYICVTVDKGSSPRPDFTLTGIPNENVFTSCQQVTCRDVEIIDSTVTVPGVILEGESNSVGLSVSFTAAANGGTAVGSGLWNITGFASNNNDGSGTRYGESSLTLSATQAATTLNFGSSATIGGITFPLDLQNGPTCSQFGYICIVVEKGDNASPDYELTPAQSTSCSPVDCRSVDISQTTAALLIDEVFYGQEQVVSFDVSALANPAYGSVSGTDLWEIAAWLSDNPSGSGRIAEDTVDLTSLQSNLPAVSGSSTTFTNLMFPLDLRTFPQCTDFSYFCVELQRGSASSVDFSLSGNVMSCVPITCSDIDECDSFPCLNGGTCNDLLNRYTCDCLPGFTGTHCEMNINECASMPCENGGNCMDQINSYVCDCAPGYEGTHCEIEINECDSSPCLNGGICNDLINRYTCTCPGGYTDYNCETDINECSSSPCENGGTCNNGINRFDCVCVPGFTGVRCQININECASSPCQYGGTCSDLINAYICTCAPGYTGINCETNINECASSPCRYGGTCNDGINGFTCACAPGFTGILCQTDINECASNPCQQGSCLDRVNAYECVCYPGYSGPNCDNNVDECGSSPCMNGGQCVDSVNSFTCNCRPGYTGTYCEIDINECASVPCQNGGACVDGENMYSCTCLPGYTGRNCEININECLSSPCLNGGTCVDYINSFTCQCAPGFEGTFCEINIDECASNPCLNGGTCLDGVNMYTCQCTSEWTGLRCETTLNACRSFPCQNGANCVNAGTSYICECNAGFAGRNCENDIDECSSLPCQNGGRCIDGPAMYTCQCPQGFSGTNCEDVGFCDLEGEWYNECNDKITLSRTSTGMLLGDHVSSVELLTGYSAPTVVVGYANRNCDFPSFGFVVTKDNGQSTTSWSGQCQLCDGEEVLYTTWTNSKRVNTCAEVKQATLIGQDKWTRYQQSQAPRVDL